MTDEEKARHHVTKVLCSQCSEYETCIKHCEMFKIAQDSHIAGLSEGRKEAEALKAEIKEIEKVSDARYDENQALKAQIERMRYDMGTLYNNLDKTFMDEYYIIKCKDIAKKWKLI